MPLIDGICARSLVIAVFLAVSKALQIQSSPGDESDAAGLAEGVQRSEEIRTALTLMGGMVVVTWMRARKAVLCPSIHEADVLQVSITSECVLGRNLILSSGD